jgi:hypothetical protein
LNQLNGLTAFDGRILVEHGAEEAGDTPAAKSESTMNP